MDVKVSAFGDSNIIATAALTWHDAGCSIIPIRADGTKKPWGEWKQYMTTPHTRDWVKGYYISNPHVGIGIVCGKVSGNLEMLELEGRAATGEDIDKIVSECESRGIAYLFTSLMTDGYAEWTPSGGLHFLYRISGHEIPGNTKIARRLATPEELADKPGDKIKVLAETRGEGGYLVAAPSGGAVHATGDSWSVAAGELGLIPTISWDERCRLHEAIHAALDEMPAQATLAPRPLLASLLPGSVDRPGDDFNTRADWRDILAPHGWTISHTAGHTTYWVRPGKDRKGGHSATTGRSADGDRLYVFSSATQFEPETPYNKFSAYALLEHNGDFAAAARALRSLGYGATTASSVAPAVTSGLAREGWQETAVAVPAASPAAGTQVAKIADWRYDWAAPSISDAAIVASAATNLGAGQLYAKGYERSFKYCAEQKKWHFYTGKVWAEDLRDRHEQAGIHLIGRAAVAAEQHDIEEWKKWARTASRAANPAAIARWARVDPRIGVDCSSFDRQRHVIAMDNGTYDLDTDTFTASHDPDQLLTKLVPVAYDKDAQAPDWEAFLAQVLPDEAMRGYLQRAIGHTLLGDAQERALFLLHGDPGTGKSQVIKVLEMLFGDFAETADPTTFNEQSKRATISNGLNDLRGKRFVSLSELEEGEKLNESLIKRLTGGDTAKSRGLYQENKQWQVQFTLWMATNYLPKLNSDDAAMWRRVKPIKFPTVIAEQGKEIKRYGEKLFAKESAGILNWVLQGVRMYLAEGLDDLEQITEAVTQYRRDVDTVAQFVQAATEEHLIAREPAQQMPSRTLNAMYQTWCNTNGIRWLGERRFAQRMESLGFERKRTNTGTVWLGVGTGAHGVLGTMVMRQ